MPVTRAPDGPVSFSGLARLAALPDGDLLACGTEGLAILRVSEMRWEGPLPLLGRRVDLQAAPTVTDAGALVPGFLPDPGLVVRWRPLSVADMPPADEPREQATAVGYGSSVFVCGGTRPGSIDGQVGITADVECLDLERRTRRRVASMPSPRSWAEAVRVAGRVVLCGGTTRLPEELLSVDVYEVTSDRWRSTRPHWPPPAMPDPATLAGMRNAMARDFGPLGIAVPPSDQGPPVPKWVAPVALSGGSVLLTLVAQCWDMSLSLLTMARVNPATLEWSEVLALPNRWIPDGPMVPLPGDRVAMLGYANGGPERFLLWSNEDGWSPGPTIHSESHGRQLAVLADGRVALADLRSVTMYEL